MSLAGVPPRDPGPLLARIRLRKISALGRGVLVRASEVAADCFIDARAAREYHQERGTRSERNQDYQ